MKRVHTLGKEKAPPDAHVHHARHVKEIHMAGWGEEQRQDYYMHVPVVHSLCGHCDNAYPHGLALR